VNSGQATLHHNLKKGSPLPSPPLPSSNPQEKKGREAPLHSMTSEILNFCMENFIPKIGCHYFWPGLNLPFLRTPYLVSVFTTKSSPNKLTGNSNKEVWEGTPFSTSIA
jgi:hypothetical protein